MGLRKDAEMSNPIMQYFEYEHLPVRLRAVSKQIYDAANEMDCMVPDGPEKSAGLRKLLEAKDCFVRAALAKPVEDKPVDIYEEGYAAWNNNVHRDQCPYPASDHRSDEWLHGWDDASAELGEVEDGA